jgi:hypothetical protein
LPNSSHYASFIALVQLNNERHSMTSTPGGANWNSSTYMGELFQREQGIGVLPLRIDVFTASSR